MGTVVPTQPRLDRPHATTLAQPETGTELTEVEFLREQNQQLRDLVVQLSKLVVRHVLEK
jgi:hypothetical protein